MLEHEVKFAPGPWFEVPDLAGIVPGVQADAPETLALQAAYYDTDDLRIVRSGASLRHRSDDAWTVKLPLGRDDGLTRDEVHIDGEPGEPPEGALDLVRALTRSAPIRLVAQLNTARKVVVLRDRHGRPLAEVVDDEVSVLDGMRLAARFREVEVEFTDEGVFIGSMAGAVKARDLRRDGRYALHSPTLDPPAEDPESWPGEAKLAGVAVEVGARASPADAHRFHLTVSEVVLTRVAGDRLVIASWHEGRGYQERSRT